MIPIRRWLSAVVRKRWTPPADTNLDSIRHNLEKMPAHLYLEYRYYERWLYHLTTAQVMGGHITVDEVAAGRAAAGNEPRTDAAGPETVDPHAVEEYKRTVAHAPRHALGDPVVTKNDHPSGHTRLPRYARGRQGTVRLHHGAHILPDSNAHGRGESPTHLYTVAFAAPELWGEDGDPNDTILLDIWECHLEPR